MRYVLSGGPADGRMGVVKGYVFQVDVPVLRADACGYDTHSYEDSCTYDDDEARVYAYAGITGGGELVTSF